MRLATFIFTYTHGQRRERVKNGQGGNPWSEKRFEGGGIGGRGRRKGDPWSEKGKGEKEREGGGRKRRRREGEGGKMKEGRGGKDTCAGQAPRSLDINACDAQNFFLDVVHTIISVFMYFEKSELL